MSVLFDTSVLIDVLRGNDRARRVLKESASTGPAYCAEITRIELLGGMRPDEQLFTRALIRSLTWEPLTEEISEQAGEFGRKWLPSHGSIDAADLAIAATAAVKGHALCTRNIKHFPMFPGLSKPY
ncbi:MAG: PIN domain-containing protein [Angustibacter sp.]